MAISLSSNHIHNVFSWDQRLEELQKNGTAESAYIAHTFANPEVYDWKRTVTIIVTDDQKDKIASHIVLQTYCREGVILSDEMTSAYHNEHVLNNTLGATGFRVSFYSRNYCKHKDALRDRDHFHSIALDTDGSTPADQKKARVYHLTDLNIPAINRKIVEILSSDIKWCYVPGFFNTGITTKKEYNCAKIVFSILKAGGISGHYQLIESPWKMALLGFTVGAAIMGGYYTCEAYKWRKEALSEVSRATKKILAAKNRVMTGSSMSGPFLKDLTKATPNLQTAYELLNDFAIDAVRQFDIVVPETKKVIEASTSNLISSTVLTAVATASVVKTTVFDANTLILQTTTPAHVESLVKKKRQNLLPKQEEPPSTWPAIVSGGASFLAGLCVAVSAVSLIFSLSNKNQ